MPSYEQTSYLLKPLSDSKFRSFHSILAALDPKLGYHRNSFRVPTATVINNCHMRRWNSQRQRQLCLFVFDRFLATDASFEINKVTLVVGLFLAADAGCGVYKKNRLDIVALSSQRTSFFLESPNNVTVHERPKTMCFMSIGKQAHLNCDDDRRAIVDFFGDHSYSEYYYYNSSTTTENAFSTSKQTVPRERGEVFHNMSTQTPRSFFPLSFLASLKPSLSFQFAFPISETEVSSNLICVRN
ncbi:hypothetical protein YC2023_018709 [Brassica napus]